MTRTCWQDRMRRGVSEYGRKKSTGIAVADFFDGGYHYWEYLLDETSRGERRRG